jgi:hypothetical protein
MLHAAGTRLRTLFGGRQPYIYQGPLLHWSSGRTGTIVQGSSSVWYQHISNGILLGFVLAVSDRLIEEWNLSFVGLSLIGRDGMRFGLLAALLSVLLLSDRGSIRPSEILAWSWRRFWRFLCRREHIKNSLLILPSIGLAYGISYGIAIGVKYGPLNGFSKGVAFGIGYSLSLALCYWLILSLFQGLSSESIDNRQRIKPNEGIRRSMRNMLMMLAIGCCIGMFIYITSNTLYLGLENGIFASLPHTSAHPSKTAGGHAGSTATHPSTTAGKQSGAVAAHASTSTVAKTPKKSSDKKHTTKKPATQNTSGFIGGILDGWHKGLAYAWIAAIVTGLLAALLSGGLASLRHAILRLLLWRSSALPLKAPHFLDYAAERILLRKVGGGYIFLHPLLLNYFATLPLEPNPSGKTTRPAISSKASPNYISDSHTSLA